MQKYRKWLVVSLVFLAVAFVMPIYVLYTASSILIQQAINTTPDYQSSNPQTSSHSGIVGFLQDQSTAQTQLLIIVVVAEALLIACFGVTLWYGIKCRDQCRTYPTP